MISALAHGLLGSVLAVILGLLAAIMPHPVDSPATATYNGPSPLVVTRPSRPVERRPVVVTVAGLPAGIRDLRLIGAPGTPHRIAPREWRLRTVAPRLPGAWLLTLRFRLHGRVYTAPGSVLEVAVHP